MNYNDIYELCDFTEKVFNYYNGRINTVVPSRLKINTIYDGSCLLGKNRLCYIEINIGVIFIKFGRDVNVCKLIILETVIHELFHADQVTDDSLYGSNEQYTDSIEMAVEYNTSLYILNNRDEVLGLIGAEVSLEKYEFYGKSSSFLYERTNLEMFYFQLVKNMFIRNNNPIAAWISIINKFDNILLCITLKGFIDDCKEVIPIKIDGAYNQDICKVCSILDFYIPANVDTYKINIESTMYMYNEIQYMALEICIGDVKIYQPYTI